MCLNSGSFPKFKTACDKIFKCCLYSAIIRGCLKFYRDYSEVLNMTLPSQSTGKISSGKVNPCEEYAQKQPKFNVCWKTNL